MFQPLRRITIEKYDDFAVIVIHRLSTFDFDTSLGGVSITMGLKYEKETK